MNKFYYLLFILFFSCTGFTQVTEKNYRLHFPEFIPINSSFEVSIVIANSYINADCLEVFFIADEKIDLIKLKFKCFYSFNYIPLDLLPLTDMTLRCIKQKLTSIHPDPPWVNSFN